MFSYVWMGLAPLVQLRLDKAPFTTPNLDARLMLPALLIVLVGVLAWIFGNQAARLVPSTGLRRRPRVGRVSEARVYAFAFGTLVLAGYYISKSGIKLLFSNRETIFLTQLQIWSGDPATMVLITTVCTVPLIIPIASLRVVQADRRRQGKPVLGVQALTAVLVAVLLVVVNPITSSRYIFGTVIFALVTLFGVVGSKRRFRFFAIGVIAAMVLLFPYADKFRYASGQSLKQGGVVAALGSPDYDAFGQINNTVAYVDKLGSTHGRQALGVALWAVPRSAWPGKPTDTGILLANFRGYPFTNLSAPLWSELFINGGWVLLGLGMAGLGAFSRRADDKSLDWSRPLTPIGSILPFYMIILLRGSLLQATLTLSIVLLAAWYLRPRPIDP